MIKYLTIIFWQNPERNSKKDLMKLRLFYFRNFFVETLSLFNSRLAKILQLEDIICHTDIITKYNIAVNPASQIVNAFYGVFCRVLRFLSATW